MPRPSFSVAVHSLAALLALAGAAASVRAQSACDLTLPPNLAADLPDDSFVDSNGDGIDGLRCGPIFVAPTGSDSSPGTISAPMLTVGAAMLAARLYSPTRPVYIAAGTYAEQLVIEPGTSLYGGYDATAGWARSNVLPIIAGFRVEAIVNGGAQPVVLDRLNIVSAVGASNDKNSVALEVRNSPATVQINRCTIRANPGAAGPATVNGIPGVAGGNGSPGQAGSSGSNSGGNGGGFGTSPAGRLGGVGGVGGYDASNGNTGSMGLPSTNGGNGGTSGGCPSGSAGNGNSGIPGTPGSPGSNGLAGGLLGSDGAPGTNGGDGNGGGGGGGGGGGQSSSFPNFCIGDRGGGGGGGGGGASGGTGGGGGAGGGNSIALVVAGANVNATNTTFITAAAGNGRPGGVGGASALGGNPGPGGNPGGDAGAGGAGGSGGAGAQGGHGGGGGGGASVGVLISAVGSFTQSGSAFTLGPAGTGGASPGNSGLNGIGANTLLLTYIPASYNQFHFPSAVHARLYCPTGGASFPTSAIASDPDPGETFTYTITGGSPNGTATMLGQHLVFAANPGFTGVTSFPIRAQDSTGLSVDGFAVVQVGPACPADFNHSGAANVSDIFDFLSAWFAGCP